jgi:hypothetical protein
MEGVFNSNYTRRRKCLSPKTLKTRREQKALLLGESPAAAEQVWGRECGSEMSLKMTNAPIAPLGDSEFELRTSCLRGRRAAS